jgi:hypothetical protein
VEGFALFERKLEGAQVKGQCEFGVKAVEAHAAEPATVGDSEIGVDAEGAGIAFEKDELAQVHALVLADTEDSVAPLLFPAEAAGTWDFASDQEPKDPGAGTQSLEAEASVAADLDAAKAAGDRGLVTATLSSAGAQAGLIGVEEQQSGTALLVVLRPARDLAAGAGRAELDCDVLGLFADFDALAFAARGVGIGARADDHRARDPDAEFETAVGVRRAVGADEAVVACAAGEGSGKGEVCGGVAHFANPAGGVGEDAGAFERFALAEHGAADGVALAFGLGLRARSWGGVLMSLTMTGSGQGCSAGSSTRALPWRGFSMRRVVAKPALSSRLALPWRSLWSS